MDNGVNIKINPSSILLSQFEAWCHLEIINLFLKQNSLNTYEPIYGCENGFSSFLSYSMFIDESVFVYETLKLYSVICPESIAEIKQAIEYSDLEAIRNNIHTYNKHGGYKDKAETIILEQLNKFNMMIQDASYPLRDDISLVFQISDKTRYLIGSDYVIKHFIYETNNRDWEGNRFNKYAKYISSIISGFSDAQDETKYNILSLPYENKNNEVRIELFDYKSIDLFARVSLSKSTAFRLLLSLSLISYIILFLECLIDKERAFHSDLWTCFLTKLLAIKYDEAFDNLNSLIMYANEKDGAFINHLLISNGIDINTLNARQFSKRLRNTIHYQNIEINMNLLADDTTVSWIKAIYLTNSGVQTMGEFRNLSNSLLNELKILQLALQKTFRLDKQY